MTGLNIYFNKLAPEYLLTCLSRLCAFPLENGYLLLYFGINFTSYIWEISSMFRIALQQVQCHQALVWINLSAIFQTNMTTIHRTALVEYSAKQMYDLVNIYQIKLFAVIYLRRKVL